MCVVHCDTSAGKKQGKCFKKFDSIAQKCIRLSKASEKWFALANAPDKPTAAAVVESPPATTPPPPAATTTAEKK
jgi:hypothetical protein